MTERMQLRPVTRVRAEFEASPSVKAAINQFLEVPKKHIPVHTAAERIVRRSRTEEGEFNEAVDSANRDLSDSLARRALTLANNPQIQVNEETIRFLFSVRDPRPLIPIVAALNRFPSIESAFPKGALVIELAKAGLKEASELNVAKGKLIAALGDPDIAKYMTVSGVHLVTPTIPLYPVDVGNGRHLPDDDEWDKI